jgi:hypothetical protein
MNKRDLVCKNKYKNIYYYIFDLGSHPTAYIKIGKNNKFYNINYFDYDIDINVHGGITYTNNRLPIWYGKQYKDSWFIGWDYAHAGDYTLYWNKGKKYTLEEIIKDCKKVINQVISKGVN